MPSRGSTAADDLDSKELSTNRAQKFDGPVDKSSGQILLGFSRLSNLGLPIDVDTRWLGCVIPKRLARNAVTRNLLRRQCREAVRRRGSALEPGLWLLRLREAFKPQDFPSAASSALRVAARRELDQLLSAVKPAKAVAL